MGQDHSFCLIGFQSQQELSTVVRAVQYLEPTRSCTRPTRVLEHSIFGLFVAPRDPPFHSGPIYMRKA